MIELEVTDAVRSPVSDRVDVVVVGLGYIGLPTAVVLTQAGLRVHGLDVSQRVVDTVNRGEMHIEEDGLADLLAAAVAGERLRAGTKPCKANTFVIAVPTPFGPDRQPDVSYVMSAAKTIAPVLEPGNAVLLESTSPIGTTEAVAELIAQLRPDLKLPAPPGEDHDICVAYCPERVLPGRTLIELVENDRVVGGITPACAQRGIAFYNSFVRGECLPTTARAAEMVKLVENSFRDVNIAFANELSIIAEGLAIDVWEVIRLANRHPRVSVLEPGPGVGGHCIAVDPWFLVAGDPTNSRLIRTAREVNDRKSRYVIDRALTLVSALPQAKVAVLGLAFKANIDDFRESPALNIARALASGHGHRLRIVEPHATVLPDDLATRGAQLTTLETALAECEIVLVLVDHDSFRQAPPSLREGKVVYDTRGIWGST